MTVGELGRRLRRLASRFGGGRVLALGILAGFVTLRIIDPAPVQTARRQVFDLYQLAKPRERTPLPVAIVDLDEASLDALGQWPWPRTLVAELVARISRAGAIAVAFDILFAEPDRMSPGLIAESLRRLSPAARSELQGLPSNDETLAAVFARTRVIVGEAATPNKVVQAAHGEPPPAAPIAVRGASADSIDPLPLLPRFDGLLRNLPVLEQAAQGHGVITILPERDGVIRRVPSVVVAEGVFRASLGLEMLRIATGGRALLIKTDAAGIAGVVVGGVEVPTDRNGRVWVRFTRSGSHPDTISARDVLDGTVGPERLANKMVFVGTSATGLLDIKTTPVDAAMPGVAVHAQLLETILSQSYLTRPNYAAGAELVLIVVLSLFLIALLPFAGAVASLIAGGALAAAVAGSSWYLYAEHGLLLDVVYPLGAALVMFLALIFFNYYREERQRQRIRGAFQQYLSPDLVEQLAESPETLHLGGEQRQMTIMFSDVRGFTTISETYKTDPQGLTRLMNRFLTPLTNAIIERKGTIDKYMGDAIMAFWNAPLTDPDHCLHGCLAALDMLDRLDAVNAEREAEARDAGTEFLPLDVGVGLNTGECVVGNMGSDIRFDYSVLGDAVNLASRLEGQSKTYGVKIILGEATALGVRDDLAVLEIDLIRVKGKLEPERVFTLVGHGEIVREAEFAALNQATDDLLAAYRRKDWGDARTAIDRCTVHAGRYGLDALYAMYEQRIVELEADPPEADWDGVYVATSK